MIAWGMITQVFGLFSATHGERGDVVSNRPIRSCRMAVRHTKDFPNPPALRGQEIGQLTCTEYVPSSATSSRQPASKRCTCRLGTEHGISAFFTQTHQRHLLCNSLFRLTPKTRFPTFQVCSIHTPTCQVFLLLLGRTWRIFRCNSVNVAP